MAFASFIGMLPSCVHALVLNISMPPSSAATISFNPPVVKAREAGSLAKAMVCRTAPSEVDTLNKRLPSLSAITISAPFVFNAAAFSLPPMLHWPVRVDVKRSIMLTRPSSCSIYALKLASSTTTCSGFGPTEIVAVTAPVSILTMLTLLSSVLATTARRFPL